MCKRPLFKFFMWNSLINFIFLVIAAVAFHFYGDGIYEMHSNMFHVTREAFNNLTYACFGLYKLFFWVFNFVPFVVLAICGRCCKKDGACACGKPNCHCPCSCKCNCDKPLNK